MLPDVEEVAVTFFQEWRTLIRPALRYTALLLLFLMVALLLVRPLVNRLLAPVEVDEATNRLDGTLARSVASPKTVKELEAALDDALVSGRDVHRADILKQRIAEFVQREPEKGAKLLRAWLIEEGK